jgi:hypothetical protein
VLDVKLPFDEAKLIEENAEYVTRSLQLEQLGVHPLNAVEGVEEDRVKAATPGVPLVLFTRAS